ncbi:MAG: RsiV family protein [Candidatus Paceibacterota bacterium]|jgi:hypothetical protein
MKKDTALGLSAIIVVLGGIFLYAAFKPAPAKAPTEALAPSLSGIHYAEQGNGYDINAFYASSTPLQARVGVAADAEAVALMKKFVGDTIAQFKADASAATDEPKRENGNGNKQTLTIAYLMASSVQTYSYLFTIYTDASEARGTTAFRTFTFDTRSGKLVTLADAFESGVDYLALLSQISRAKLPEIIGKDTVPSLLQSGTTPTEEHFSNFFFDNQDFVVLFPQGQVAPGIVGPQTLRIKLSELGAKLRPAYR